MPRFNPRSTALYDAPFGAFEQHLLRRYALVAFQPEDGRQRHSVSDALVDWYGENRNMLGYRVTPLDAAMRRSRAERDFSGDVSWRYNKKNAPVYNAPAPPASALQKRLEWAGDTLGLDRAELAFLGAVVRMTQLHAFCQFYEARVDGRSCDDEVRATIVARMAGLNRREAAKVSGRRSTLVQLGLIESRGGDDVAVSATLVDLLATRSSDPDVLRRSLLGEMTASTLDMVDFDHLGTTRETVIQLVGGALAKREKGASVLFYGAPGTGKTEFAKLVANELGADMVFIGERKIEGVDQRLHSEPSRADRLSHLAFVSALAERAGRVVLVIDEADDIFTGVDDEEFSNRSGSKVFMNRIVENCSVPMIWITNHPGRLGEAVLRRMLFAAEFRQADHATRRRIIARHAAERGVVLAPATVESLASLPAAPALLGTGIRAAALATADGNGSGDMAIAVTRSLLKVAGRQLPPAPAMGQIAFDAGLSNADVDLVRLERQVVAAGPGALSFLFSGPPGTGKSAFARHLAEQLGLEVLEKRASDLLDMYVGESEKRIAEAFAEAADARRFLILDEADSLLSDRNGAQRSWEVSQVNEMLTWMERHPGPFAATTNLATHLDPATQRRFLFKVNFEAMTARQTEVAFLRTFGVAAPASLARLNQLTPGDFALVARRAKILAVTKPEALVEMLSHEVDGRPGNNGRIGF